MVHSLWPVISFLDLSMHSWVYLRFESKVHCSLAEWFWKVILPLKSWFPSVIFKPAWDVVKVKCTRDHIVCSGYTHGLWTQSPWVHILIELLFSHGTLGNLLSFSSSCFLFTKKTDKCKTETPGFRCPVLAFPTSAFIHLFAHQISIVHPLEATHSILDSENSLIDKKAKKKKKFPALRELAYLVIYR